MNEDKKVVIELQNVKRYFKVGSETVKALRGVSFKIYEGEFVTIQGTSGSGKSTLLNQLGCLDTPTSGSYTIVLAYRVPLENAKIFVKNLHDNGISSAQLINYKNDNVVVYGSYKSQDEALPALNELVKSDCVTDGWIMLVE